ncbi:hypothetical protein MGYG_08324 [Nannizzia gypsea CBS 118893]|uniref:Uncharacterized protein n=1 Tax=Arthroderma gypseum (strain ATCC MYA-4604 / CBS 118893) TaxID=535722 RepID=E4V6D0_ARTGP|nr:hypothetical protein MGYG_08324 [Nannizzia gypsea CBS 118893]EFR05313.1 hypothetical protein MGYG_08324 [Nannizzia gypsea CBS 118893]
MDRQSLLRIRRATIANLLCYGLGSSDGGGQQRLHMPVRSTSLICQQANEGRRGSNEKMAQEPQEMAAEKKRAEEKKTRALGCIKISTRGAQNKGEGEQSKMAAASDNATSSREIRLRAANGISNWARKGANEPMRLFQEPSRDATGNGGYTSTERFYPSPANTNILGPRHHNRISYRTIERDTRHQDLPRGIRASFLYSESSRSDNYIASTAIVVARSQRLALTRISISPKAYRPLPYLRCQLALPLPSTFQQPMRAARDLGSPPPKAAALTIILSYTSVLANTCNKYCNTPSTGGDEAAALE